jgi:hypothetical protein
MEREGVDGEGGGGWRGRGWMEREGVDGEGGGEYTLVCYTHAIHSTLVVIPG